MNSFIGVVYCFDRISNVLVYDLSEVALIHLFMTKIKKVVSRSKAVLT